MRRDSNWAELSRRRDLLWMIVWRDIRARYVQSIMGILWAILMPLVIVTAGIMVRYAVSVVSRTDFTFRDIAAVSVKAVPWSFFVASLRSSSSSLLGNANLVTRVYMPREIFPIAAVGAQLVDLGVAAATLCVVLSAAAIGLSWHFLWAPVLLAILVTLALGLGFFASSGCLFYRDVKYLVEVFTTFAIFFTPVFFDSAMFGRYAYLLKLNPVTPVLEGLSRCIVEHQPPELLWVLYSTLISVGIFLGGYAVFKHVEPLFAERI